MEKPLFTLSLSLSLLIGLIILFSFPTITSATTYTWDGSTNTDWNTADNWTPSGVPTEGDIITITDQANDPVLDQARSISRITMTSGILDLNTFTLTATSTSTFTAGQINNGTMAIDADTSTLTTYTATVFGANATTTSGRILLNGATFNGTTNHFTKTGGTSDTCTGGNTFGANSTTTFTNLGTANWALSSTANNTFNGDILFENTSTGLIYLVSTTGVATSALADGKTISIGPAGFSAGSFLLRNFTQTGTIAQNLTLTGTASIYFQTGTTFNGSLVASAPKIYLSGSTFNGTSNNFIFTTTVNSIISVGGNTFGLDSTTTFTNTGTKIWYLSDTANNTFNGDIKFESTNGGYIYLVSSAGVATSVLADGKTISIGPAGFSSGAIYLRNLTQTGTTAQTLNLTGTASIKFQTGTTFNGSLAVSAPSIYLDGSTFNGATNSFTFTGSSSIASVGGNTFGSDSVTIFANTGTRSWYLSSTANNTFNGDVIFENTNYGNICLTLRSSLSILADGKTLSIGPAGFNSGTLSLTYLTQTGTTPQSLTLTGSGIVAFGTGTTINGNLTVSAPDILTTGATFNGTTNFTRTGLPITLGDSDLSSGMSASVVIGQPDFVHNADNQGLGPLANTLYAQRNVYYDGTRLFVADRSNNRVLIYNSLPTTNNASADVVIGQPDMTSNTVNNGGIGANTLSAPTSVYSDGIKLIISDYDNYRVLIYNTIPITNGASADVVIGQPDMTSNTANNGGIDAHTLNGPYVNSDGTRLFVSDYGNHRVLIYNTIPTSNDSVINADVVIGQPDMVSNTSNNGGIDAHTLYAPIFAYSNNNKLFISDNSNSRVLIYNTIPTSNDSVINADVVIGQPDMTSNTANNGGIGANTLAQPRGLIFFGDSFFLADYSNNRILFFKTTPTVNNASADVVIGQSDMISSTANNGGIGEDTLSGVVNISSDGKKLIASDSTNNRLLIYTLIHTPTTFLSPTQTTNTITLSVDSFSNPNLTANKYYFARSDGTNSGWITSPTWTDTNLTCNTLYTYTVKYGTGDGMESDSVSLTTHTEGCPSSSGSTPTNRLNNLLAQGNIELATQIQQQYNLPPFASSSPLSQSTPTTASPTFTRDLKLRTTHPEVKLLQHYLNTHGYPVAQTGPGSLNHETTYFGSLTKQALIKFQLAHQIKPAVGYFGVVTRRVVGKFR